MRLTRTPQVLGAVTLLAMSMMLAGCGTPPWVSTDVSNPVVATPKPTATAITTVVNELANGSTEHLLSAGSIGLTVDYYSTLNMDQWTADANKPLSISMKAQLTGDEGQHIYLSELTVAVAVYGPDGVLPSPAQLLDRSTITPGYLVKAPYSYGQTFVLPPVDAAATYVTLSLTYELLLQTTPTSVEYAKQTASDTLTIAIAEP